SAVIEARGVLAAREALRVCIALRAGGASGLLVLALRVRARGAILDHGGVGRRRRRRRGVFQRLTRVALVDVRRARVGRRRRRSTDVARDDSRRGTGARRRRALRRARVALVVRVARRERDVGILPGGMAAKAIVDALLIATGLRRAGVDEE